MLRLAVVVRSSGIVESLASLFHQHFAPPLQIPHVAYPCQALVRTGSPPCRSGQLTKRLRRRLSLHASEILPLRSWSVRQACCAQFVLPLLPREKSYSPVLPRATPLQFHAPVPPLTQADGLCFCVERLNLDEIDSATHRMHSALVTCVSLQA